MATLAEINSGLDALLTAVDEVAVIVANLKAGQTSQAEIDAVGAKIEALTVKIEGLKA